MKTTTKIRDASCRDCGEEQWEALMTNGRCFECYRKTPEGKAEAKAELEAQARRMAEEIALIDREVDRMVNRIVSPEIHSTDITHPEFNADAWQRLRDNGGVGGDGKVWPWLFSPSSGRSKSRIAFLTALEVIKRWERTKAEDRCGGSYPCHVNDEVLRWIDGDQLCDFSRSQNQYSDPERMNEARSAVARCRTVKLLVIDDLFKGNWKTPATTDGLFKIIKHRHEHHLLTIITDNVPPAMVKRLVHPDRANFITRRLEERLLAVNCE